MVVNGDGGVEMTTANGKSDDNSVLLLPITSAIDAVGMVVVTSEESCSDRRGGCGGGGGGGGQ